MKPLAFALLLATLVAGCGGSSGGDAASQNASADLEALITRQLPAKVRRYAGPGSYVNGVHCIHGTGRAYECIASVSGSSAYTGRPERVQLAISATCDGHACIWRITP